MKLPRLREWRESRGLTQKELAAKARVGEVTVARIETDAHTTTPPTARKLADALGISVADLLESPPVPLEPAPSASPEGTTSGAGQSIVGGFTESEEQSFGAKVEPLAAVLYAEFGAVERGEKSREQAVQAVLEYVASA